VAIVIVGIYVSSVIQVKLHGRRERVTMQLDQTVAGLNIHNAFNVQICGRDVAHCIEILKNARFLLIPLVVLIVIYHEVPKEMAKKFLVRISTIFG
jgi:hypothetical protein